MGQFVTAAQDVLSEFVDRHRRWRRFLESGPAGQENGDIARMIEQLDAARRTLDRLHDANEQANNGNATIPSRTEFEENLDLGRMHHLRRDLAKARRHAEDGVDALGVVVTHPDLLDEFDDLEPVERLAFLNELLSHAGAIHEMEADKASATASSSVALQRRRQFPSVLAAIGDQHVLSPERIRKLAADLPLEFTRDDSNGHGAGIAAANAAERRKIESQIDAALGAPPGPAVTAAWKLAGQYGNLVHLIAPILAAAESRQAADDALVALYRHLTPLLGTTSTPKQVRQSLQNKRDALSQVDADFFLQIELPLKAALGGLDIYLALQKFFADPSADSALQDAATALLKAGELLVEAAKEVESAGTSTAQKATRAARVLRIAGATIGLALFVLDLIAAEKGISDATRYRDYSVAVGEVLKAGGAAVLFGTPAVAALLGVSATTGPALIVVGVAVALVLIGEALIAWTQDTELEKFAAVCAFGKNPATSDDPGLIEYRFRAGGHADIPRQLERLRTMFNPLGFRITIQAGNRNLEHSRPTEDGPVALRFPVNTDITVSLVEADGSTTQWTSTGTIPFDPDRFRTEGFAVESSFNAQGLVGRWMEMEVVLPGAGADRTLREYAVIP